VLVILALVMSPDYLSSKLRARVLVARATPPGDASAPGSTPVKGEAGRGVRWERLGGGGVRVQVKPISPLKGARLLGAPWA
jgi:hypothetical protein